VRKAEKLTTFVCRFCVDWLLGTYIQESFMYLVKGCNMALPNAVEHVAKYITKHPLNQ